MNGKGKALTKALMATALVAFVALTYVALMPLNASAQTPMSLSVNVNNTAGNVTVSNLYYYLKLDLKDGARAEAWLVNVTTPALLPLVPTGSLVTPTPLLAISSPNSTEVTLPGNLEQANWVASVVSSSPTSETIMLTPAGNETYPFNLVEYVTVSSLLPCMKVLIVVTNKGTAPASGVLAYGIGSAGLTGSWRAAVELENGSNGSYSIIGLSNATSASGQALTASAVYFNESGAPLAAIGLSYVSPQASFEFLEGKLFGLNESQAFIVGLFSIPELQPGESYKVSFEAFAIGFNPFELASTGSLEVAQQLYPNITSRVPATMNVDGVTSYLNSQISSLNSSLNSVEQEVNNLSAKLYYYERQLEVANNAEGYYRHLATRGGLLAGGMFIVGVVIGVLGGAYLLSPRGVERRQPARKK